MRVLIVGCGYVGLATGAELVKQGHQVFGLRRTNSAEGELKARGIEPLVGDITRLPELQRLPGPFEWVVNTVSSTKGGVEGYRQVYLQGMRNLVTWLAAEPPSKFIYTSSTSVYGQTDGSVVDESSVTEPEGETSRVLLEAEQVLRDAAGGSVGRRDACPTIALPAVILRVAGIYGPERGYWFRQYLRGEARMTGRGERILNMIHRDDVAGSIIAALERGRPGEIYNAADDEPVAQIDFFRWLSAALGRTMPPLAAEGEEITPKREFTDKRVSNRKLRTKLGYRFKYPTFREGFGEEIRRLGIRRERG